MLTPAEVERRLYGAPLPDINRPPPLTSISAGAAEARATLEKLMKANQPKEETEMPDMQTALLSAISNWDDEPNPRPTTEKTMTQPAVQPAEKKPLFTITNNISRETFNCVRDNPGCTYKQIEGVIKGKGLNVNSVSSLLSQMYKQGMIAKQGKGGKATYFPRLKEYVPIKATATLRNMAARQAAAANGIAALKPATKAKPLGEQLRDKLEEKRTSPLAHGDDAAAYTQAKQSRMVLLTTQTPQQILSSLNILQARALYDELKKVFGG
jgi:hypothetical protein